MAEETTNESLEFRTEVRQLLNILAKSLYTKRELFLRELISNASDALHRVQFEMLTNRDVVDADAELAIRIEADEDAQRLTISDTGVGMTHEELIQDLGTIAHSGALAFLRSLEEGQEPADVIGQFGVGFYSVFMVADEVTVRTRSYRPEAEAWRWRSEGDSSFTISPGEMENRGTTIEIALREDASEFASPWRLKQIIKKHSDYVSFPIYVNGEIANQQTALWRQLPQEVDEAEYNDFYHQLTLDFEPPLLHIHLVTDVPIHVRSLLYVPCKRRQDLPALQETRGLRLYSRKVLIEEKNEELLPEYLAFVKGVVDSQDIPLNVSRESVQSSLTMSRIRKILTGRVIKSLKALADEDVERYRTFWESFGLFIKQGVITDPAHREALLPLLRFPSSDPAIERTSLAGYVERMDDDQEAIYYILGDDERAVTHSPHLDYFRSHDIEVLYLLDPFDGVMMREVANFADLPLQNVDAPDLDLKQPATSEEAAAEEEGIELEPLVSHIKRTLGERVTDVRTSEMLTDSPGRLISPEGGADRDLRRVRRLMGEQAEPPKHQMEINPRHALIRNLARRLEREPKDSLIDASIHQLYENLLLLEGVHPNPAQMVPRIWELLKSATTPEE